MQAQKWKFQLSAGADSIFQKVSAKISGMLEDNQTENLSAPTSNSQSGYLSLKN